MKKISALMLVILFCQVQYVESKPREYSGVAARYSPGTMQRVAKNRGIPIEDCMVAATFERIGTWVYITGSRTGNTLLCKVIDVPARKDRRNIERRGIIAEVDHKHAVTLCGSAVEKPERCKISMRIANGKT